MTPHPALHERMARLAQDLRSIKSPATTLGHVVDLAVSIVGPCQHAGISLVKRQGAIATSASSGEVPSSADELQAELGEGPLRDAVWQDPLVVVADLETESRWPVWAPRAAQELGVRSVVCLRLFTHQDRVGALSLYALEPDAFTHAEVEEAIAIAAHAAVAVVAVEQIERLEIALHSRTAIGQATGIIMGRYKLNSSAAFQLLVRISNEENRKISAIAAQLVEQHDIDPSRELGLKRRLQRAAKPRRVTGRS